MEEDCKILAARIQRYLNDKNLYNVNELNLITKLFLTDIEELTKRILK